VLKYWSGGIFQTLKTGLKILELFFTLLKSSPKIPDPLKNLLQVVTQLKN
jgi:hypothetical protein